MKKIIQSKRGDGYIDVVVAVLVSMMLLILALNIFSFFTLKQDMDYYAKEVLEVACVEGRTSGKINNRYFDISDEMGFYPSYSWQTTYYNTTYQRVQLGDQIKITMTYRTYLNGFGIFKIPVTLTVTQSGISEKYWK